MTTPEAQSTENPPAGFLARLNASRNVPQSKIAQRRNHPVRRLLRFVRSYWWLAVLIYIVTRASMDAEFLNLILLGLGFAFRLVFAIMFVVIQFGSIFWFMSRTKVEVIRPGDPKTLTFDDYQGQDHLLELVKQWISLLSDREKFQTMGGSFINGLLLYGPPGTGKTLLAKVMAGEAGVAFISIEGSGFRGMFWGMDVLRMIWFIGKARKLAREYGACIAFIDEIDAVGSSRGAVMGGSGNQGTVGAGMGGMFGGGSGALTRLLYEMDGVGEQTRWEKLQARIYPLLGKEPPQRDWHTLFMGSTNRPDVLDPALKRPGRFDRVIEVAIPDRRGRQAIVEYYVNKIKTNDTVDVEAIVSDTSGYTPAQIMSAITKDAVRLALFDERDTVSQRDIDLAFQEQAMGLENPIEEWDEDQRRQVAYHEAGHAVAVHYLMPEKRIVRTTIIRRSGALGYVHSADTKEIYAAPLSWWIKRIMLSLAGDVSTKILYGEAWSGTGSDFQTVRAMLWNLATHGFFGPPVDNPVELYKNEMTQFWKTAEDRTEKLLREHWEEVQALAEALIEHGDLTGKDVLSILAQVNSQNGRAVSEETPADAPEAVVAEPPGANAETEVAEPPLEVPTISPQEEEQDG